MCGIWAYLIKSHIGYDKDVGELYKTFKNIHGRGPNNSHFEDYTDRFILGFMRLPIMAPNNGGDQPFKFYDKTTDTNYFCICNGEIYNAEELKSKYIEKQDYEQWYIKNKVETGDVPPNYEPKFTYKFISGSDCEVLIPLFIAYGIDEMLKMLKGVFSFVIVKERNDEYGAFIARDKIGIRPSFIGYDEKNGNLAVCSEAKGMLGNFKNIEVFPPGHYLRFDSTTHTTIDYCFHQYHTYENYTYNNNIEDHIEDKICKEIETRLIESVRRRLISDRPVCALLSGGLDSSLVCAIASRILKNRGQVLYTFSIGMKNSPDNKYAQMVADYIGSVHTVIEISKEEALNSIDSVIWCTETHDITTIRASVGQYLVTKYIADNTDFKVILSGDGSDELTSGYLYNYNAPSDVDIHTEAIYRIMNIYWSDVLRADRATSCNGEELRVPLLDTDFVDYYLSIHPSLRRPTKERMEKYLLRKSFEGYLPKEVLYRQKEAFSDGITAQNDSWYQAIQTYVEDKISDEELEEAKKIYTHCTPKTKEGLYFMRKFCDKFGQDLVKLIPEHWMPKWVETDDPSARTITGIYKTESLVTDTCINKNSI